MVTSNAYDTYKQNAIMTASPEELTLMLYNGLIKFIMIARKAIEEKDVPRAHENIIRAQDIVNEFKASLNMQYEISHNLNMLYDYFLDRLLEANIRKDTAILDEVLRFVRELRDTWAQAMKIAKQQNKKAAGAAE
ncbi:MAG TPA: flagellar export chaperone FliS [Clostridiales bacterium]|nr:flagellar export chaperone FliS [Clostridiales bacterium]HPV01398.1 flagellar export chaperone FliS [Clostridiales bacterium]